MKYKKFRDLQVDVFKINFKNFRVSKIINYMPAGNDVVEVLTTNDKKYFLKIERSKVADFVTENKNINRLHEINYMKAPNIIEFIDNDNFKCIVLEKINGKRLSEFINDKNKKYYIEKLGEELAKIHSIKLDNMNIAKQRVINDIPPKNFYGEEDIEIKTFLDFLQENNYIKTFDTFIHGDFHYGNILWYNRKLVGVLDWEYSGLGHKEQDIAWALIYRPNQKFMNSILDIQNFLSGYKSIGEYDSEKVKWCLINGLTHFYLMNKDKEYKKNLKKLMDDIIKTEL